MKYRRYTAPEVVEQTREAIHLFIRKQIDPFVALLDENFVWIGDYEPLYMCGIPAFLESVKTEMQELPVNITEEEYTLLSHEQHLWITYGRFTANTGGLAAKVHFTPAPCQRQPRQTNAAGYRAVENLRAAARGKKYLEKTGSETVDPSKLKRKYPLSAAKRNTIHKSG